MKTSSRTIATNLLVQVLIKKQSLSRALDKLPATTAEYSFIKALVFGTLRNYHKLFVTAHALLHKPLAQKDQDIFILLLVGLYQLLDMDLPPYAAISETVNATRNLKKPWAKGLINKLLRTFNDNKDTILDQVNCNEVALYSHPKWFIKKIKKSYPNQWQEILNANNQKPPLTLRVNQQKISRDKYLELLKENNIDATPTTYSPDGIIITNPIPVSDIPNFKQGFVSVQDEAAQLAAPLLDLKPGMRILDACAAPGGKTCHILELHPDLEELVSIDKDKKSLDKLTSNLERLDLDNKKVTVLNHDVNNIDDWWDGKKFDRILLDAPCSATGIIRRHPDIKIHRSKDDIENLSAQQRILLENLMPLLKNDGLMLYATCSVMPEENSEQLEGFLKEHSEIKEISIEAEWGIGQAHGRQLLPNDRNSTDGFYYLKLITISPSGTTEARMERAP